MVFSGTPVFCINKTDHHDITEIFLKMALNTMTGLHKLFSCKFKCQKWLSLLFFPLLVFVTYDHWFFKSVQVFTVFKSVQVFTVFKPVQVFTVFKSVQVFTVFKSVQVFTVFKSVQVFTVCLYMYCCLISNYHSGLDPINRCNPATFVCLSQIMTWSSKSLCRVLSICIIQEVNSVTEQKLSRSVFAH